MRVSTCSSLNCTLTLFIALLSLRPPQLPTCGSVPVSDHFFAGGVDQLYLVHSERAAAPQHLRMLCQAAAGMQQQMQLLHDCDFQLGCAC